MRKWLIDIWATNAILCYSAKMSYVNSLKSKRCFLGIWNRCLCFFCKLTEWFWRWRKGTLHHFRYSRQNLFIFIYICNSIYGIPAGVIMSYFCYLWVPVCVTMCRPFLSCRRYHVFMSHVWVPVGVTMCRPFLSCRRYHVFMSHVWVPVGVTMYLILTCEFLLVSPCLYISYVSSCWCHHVSPVSSCWIRHVSSVLYKPHK